MRAVAAPNRQVRIDAQIGAVSLCDGARLVVSARDASVAGSAEGVLACARIARVPASGTCEATAKGVVWLLERTRGGMWRTERATLVIPSVLMELTCRLGFNPALLLWRVSLARTGGPAWPASPLALGDVAPCDSDATPGGAATLVVATRAPAAGSPLAEIPARAVLAVAVECAHVGSPGEWVEVARHSGVRVPARGGGVCTPDRSMQLAFAEGAARRRKMRQVSVAVSRAAVLRVAGGGA